MIPENKEIRRGIMSRRIFLRADIASITHGAFQLGSLRAEGACGETFVTSQPRALSFSIANTPAGSQILR